MSAEIISSKNNARIKAIRKLRHRSERDRVGSFLVEGIRQVSEAIQNGAQISDLIVAPDLLRSQFALDMVDEQRHRDVPILLVTADVFASISERDHPQGLAAIARQTWQSIDQVSPAAESLWVGLDSVADPGNLGTILRTADAVGASGIVLLGHSTDPYDPTAVRASMGAVFTQRLIRATADDLVQWAGQHRVSLVGTSPAASVEYQSVDYSLPLLLLMGSERQGLPDSLQHACDQLVRLPMAGRVDSLNLAVATGVMLYEIFNQRRRRLEEGSRRGRRPRRGRSGGPHQSPGSRHARSQRRRPG